MIMLKIKDIPQMVKYIFLSLSIIFICSNCIVYKAESFLVKQPIDNRIPKMNVKIDTNFFKNDDNIQLKGFSYQKSGDISSTEVYLGTPYTTYSFGTNRKSSFVITKAGLDATKLIEMELQENIFRKSENKTFGKIKWRLKRLHTTSNPLWFLSSLATLFSINIIGYPIASQTTILELELELFDNNNKSIGIYSAGEKRTAYSAMWWGYFFGGAAFVQDYAALTKASRQKALSAALQSIKKQIEKDALKITNRLLMASNFNDD